MIAAATYVMHTTKNKYNDNERKISVTVYHNDRQLYLHGICLECLSMRSLLILSHIYSILNKNKFLAMCQE
ncbi:unnamed protein product [Rotaria sordida]|uniref:Uncharacterized protein n=1 Tax=Rotaria sordida TaxID=392033 RepID=A0A814B0G2_9BILA|nr:unnamed protein product [Rotaria sordida]